MLAEGFPGKRVLQLNPSGYGNSKVEISLFTSISGSMDDARFLDRLELSNLHPFGKNSLPVEFTISLDSSQQIKMKLFDETSGALAETLYQLVAEDLSDAIDVIEDVEPIDDAEIPVEPSVAIEPLGGTEAVHPVEFEAIPDSPVDVGETSAEVELESGVDTIEVAQETAQEVVEKKGGKNFFDKLRPKKKKASKETDDKNEKVSKVKSSSVKKKSDKSPATSSQKKEESPKFMEVPEESPIISEAVSTPKKRPPLKRKNLLDNYNFVAVQKVKVNSAPIVISVVCAAVSVISLLVAYGFYRFGSELGAKPAPASGITAAKEPVTQLPLVESAMPEEERPGEIPQNQNEIVVINEGTILPQKPIQADESMKELRYKVIWGDTLWDIAAAHYKDPWKFRRIAEYNEIRNPDYIVAGKWIVIPSN